MSAGKLAAERKAVGGKESVFHGDNDPPVTPASARNSRALRLNESNGVSCSPMGALHMGMKDLTHLHVPKICQH